MTKQASLTKTSENKGKNSIAAKPKENTYQTMDSPVEQILNLQQTMGNQAVQRLIESGHLQAKLTIGQPNDKYEQEADRIADQVMRMPEKRQSLVIGQRSLGKREKESSLVNGHWSLGKKESTLVQRQEELEEEEEEQIQTKPLADQITPLVQRQVEPVIEEEEEEETVQPKSTDTQPQKVTPNIESRIQSLKSGGQPLSKSTRDFFEPRFGADFSQVRVHTDSRAAETAKSINAIAFTKGNDVIFGSREYSPETSPGNQLLAHELTHVIQQGGSNNVISRKDAEKKTPGKVDWPEDLHENIEGDPSQATKSTAEIFDKIYSNAKLEIGHLMSGEGLKMNTKFWHVAYVLEKEGRSKYFWSTEHKTAFKSYKEYKSDPATHDEFMRDWDGGTLNVKVYIGDSPSDSISDVMNENSSRKYDFECFTAASLFSLALIYNSFQGTNKEFDQRYYSFSIFHSLGSVELIMSSDPNLGLYVPHTLPTFNVGWTIKEFMKETAEKPNQINLIPGDWVSFNYYPVNEAPEGWATENAIYLGGAEFYGHPIGKFTAQKYAGILYILFPKDSSVTIEQIEERTKICLDYRHRLSKVKEKEEKDIGVR